jgi:hypothetical protein
MENRLYFFKERIKDKIKKPDVSIKNFCVSNIIFKSVFVKNNANINIAAPITTIGEILKR